MKRSEMIQNILGFLENSYPESNDHDGIPEGLLEQLENWGMQPPSIRCGGYHSDENGYANEWSDE